MATTNQIASHNVINRSEMANELGQKQSKRRQYTATIKIGQQYDF